MSCLGIFIDLFGRLSDWCGFVTVGPFGVVVDALGFGAPGAYAAMGTLLAPSLAGGGLGKSSCASVWLAGCGGRGIQASDGAGGWM